MEENNSTIQDNDWSAKNLLCTADRRRKKAIAANLRSPAKQVKALALRAKIIVTTSENPDWTDAQVAQTVGCSPALVRKWRLRWCQTRSLEEAARPGRPRIFQAIVPAQVTAFALRVAAGIACSKPTDFDLPLAFREL